MPAPFVSLLSLAALAMLPVMAAAQSVTIYRCIGPGNTLTLRDSPCAAGEAQETRAMQRPKDPPPGAAIAPSPAPAVAPAPAPVQVVVYRTPPRPLYECITPDGSRYDSESSEGNPRWVPLWTLGYRAWSHRSPSGGVNRPPGQDRPQPRPLPGLLPAQGMIMPVGGTWVRDECHALPQQEVCARLLDRRRQIMRRYNSALQSEVNALRLEQRGIDARLANDCGND